MGLRDEAEKAVGRLESEKEQRKRAEAENEEKHLARIRDYIPTALAEWARGMGLASVPRYTLGERSGATCYFTFIEDGLKFWGRSTLGMHRPLDDAPVTTIGYDLREVKNVEDLARALKDEADRGDEKPRRLVRPDRGAGIGMGNL